MAESCDCTMHCGSDPDVINGRIQPCAWRQKIEEKQRRARQAESLCADLGHADVLAAIEELQRLHRNEFICIKCGLRKDGEHDRPADF